MKVIYMIIIWSDNPVYAQILKCERSGQNLTFNNLEEASDKVEYLESFSGTKTKIVAI